MNNWNECMYVAQKLKYQTNISQALAIGNVN